MSFPRSLILGICLLALAWISAAEPPATKSPPPDPQSLAQASRMVRDVFQAELARTRTASQHREFSQRLLKSAAEENTSAANRYAILLLARDVAIEAGDVEASMTITDTILGTFSVDPLKLRLELAQALDKTARTPTARSDLIALYLSLIEYSIQTEQFDSGRRIAAAAQLAARLSDDPSLQRQITNAAVRFRETEAFNNASKKTQLALAQNPNDPGANLAVGKYYCFYKSDWPGGLPLLAKSSDATLKALAARELAMPQKAEEQVVLADDWWTVSESAPGSTKLVIQSHAVALYRKALNDLTGLTRARVEKRLASAQLAGADEGELLPTMIGKFTPGENGNVILHQGNRIKTPQTFSPPVVFRIIAQTEKNDIRLAYAADQIIFNWERNHSEMRVDGGPPNGRHKAGAGQIPTNTWVTIDLLVRPRVMAISVDGQLRHEIPADYSQVNDPLQIFGFDSTIRIKSVRVRQLAP